MKPAPGAPTAGSGDGGIPSRRPVRLAGRAVSLLLLLPLVLAGCPDGGTPEGGIDRDTLTQRQRDSITSTLPIPGAGSVGGALDAAADAQRRANQHDSILGGGR